MVVAGVAIGTRLVRSRTFNDKNTKISMIRIHSLRVERNMLFMCETRGKILDLEPGLKGEG